MARAVWRLMVPPLGPEAKVTSPKMRPSFTIETTTSPENPHRTRSDTAGS